MSTITKDVDRMDFDSSHHQTSYVFVPASGPDTRPLRPKKRRKITNKQDVVEHIIQRRPETILTTFPPLLNGLENSSCVIARYRLFEESWSYTEESIKSILRKSNETTLGDVTVFVDGALATVERDHIPTGLIVTGPNIASQELLFNQIAENLRSYVDCPVVIIRSSDASNLKAVLKKVIRDATNQREEDEDDLQTTAKGGRKLLNYDLQILHDYLKSSSNQKVVVVFQDSEAFESSLLGEVLHLFSSWLDRIPFVLLLGIATSVELFHERLPRGVIRCLHGSQFDVEQASYTLEKVFEHAVVACDLPLLMGPAFISSLLERQRDHVQSIQAFVSALKYAYMCHFYANPLSIFLIYSNEPEEYIEGIQPEHMEAVRNLPSFRRKIEALLDEHRVEEARKLLDSDDYLLSEGVRNAIIGSKSFIIRLHRTMHILFAALSGRDSEIDRMDLYTKAFAGKLQESDILRDFFSSVKAMTVGEVLVLTQSLLDKTSSLDEEAERNNWNDFATELVEDLSRIHLEVQNLQSQAKATNTPVRSKYISQSKVLRTTVVAQKVHLSKEESSLSALDISYSKLLDDLTLTLEEYLKFENPMDQFLHEIWIFDSKSPYREVFTPKPRCAVERALSVPHDYLGCSCCRASEEGLSSSQPPTAILYQLYLETGSLINIFDLWSAFYAIVGGDDGDERNALAQFYKSLADLKLLGMLKQSRKKTDHLAKLTWKGL